MATQSSFTADRIGMAWVGVVRGPLVRAVRFLAAAVIYGLVALHPALAGDITYLTGSNQSLDAALTLLCPQGGSAEPQFQNRISGQIVPIANPRLRAVAERACAQILLGAADAASVKIANDRIVPIFVGYSGAGTIHWEGNGYCRPVTSGAGGLEIAPKHSCSATVTSTNSGSRFCASLYAPPNCLQAQNNHQTLIEPTFDTSDQCSWTHQAGTCVSYDISLIPVGCTDALWTKNKCSSAGGASYNLPAELSCTGAPADPTFTCEGPAGNPTTDPQRYPTKCGNPDAICTGNSQACVNAYFFPMFGPPYSPHQPVGVCSGGRTLTITFLAGP